MILLASALAAAGCAGDPVVDALTLRLVNDTDGSLACAPVQIGMVTSVEVIAVGATSGGADCLLDRACVEVDLPLSAPLGTLEDELAAAAQPVLDVETDRLRSVRLTGYTAAGCNSGQQLCGFADVADASGGQLEVGVRCDGFAAGRCDTTTLPDCP